VRGTDLINCPSLFLAPLEKIGMGNLLHVGFLHKLQFEVSSPEWRKVGREAPSSIESIMMKSVAMVRGEV